MSGKLAPTQPTLVEIMYESKISPLKAADKILNFVRTVFPTLSIKTIKINQSKLSLNSINGTLVNDAGRKYFFKFHTEEGETKTINEYYQGQVLADAGLPIIQPLYQNTTPGQQFLIYENITVPTAFELCEQFEQEYEKTGFYPVEKNNYLAAKDRLLKRQLGAYLNTLRSATSEEMSRSPLLQLFLWRLIPNNGSTARVDLFYNNKFVTLPNDMIPFNELTQKQWIINGVEYNESLSKIIQQAKNLLNPACEVAIPAVIGHGDDHNGNKFYLGNELFLFDPAFAGLQPALLSFVKATAHNTFLHPSWLYDPEMLNGKLSINYQIKDDTIVIEHNWDMAERSPLRKEILNQQIDVVWKPLLNKLREKKLLPVYWKDYLRKALFCCPFLVYNLLDTNKYSPAATLLALSKCVELGSITKNQSGLTDKMLLNKLE